MNPVLHVCSTCCADAAERIASQVASRFPNHEIDVHQYPCLGGCSARGRCSIAAESKWSWLFGGIQKDADIEALTAFAGAWMTSVDGLIPKAVRPRAMQHKILGRLPPTTAPSVETIEFVHPEDRT